MESLHQPTTIVESQVYLYRYPAFEITGDHYYRLVITIHRQEINDKPYSIKVIEDYDLSIVFLDGTLKSGLPDKNCKKQFIHRYSGKTMRLPKFGVLINE